VCYSVPSVGDPELKMVRISLDVQYFLGVASCDLPQRSL